MRGGINNLRLGIGLVMTVGLSLIQVNNVYAYGSGASGYSGSPSTNNGADCTNCHGGNAAIPTVTLTGPATATTGSTGSYTVTMSGGPAVAAGVDVAASGGTIIDTNASGTKISSGELVHSTANTMTGGTISWTFDWTAPTAAGTYTIYAAGLSTNGSGSGGDGTGLASLQITVSAVTPTNQPPVAKISGPTTGTDGIAVMFDGSGSTDPDGTIASYDWDFGDNTTGAGATVTHTYTAGTYTVMLKVTDNAGATNTATSNIVITAANAPQPPVASAGGPYSGTEGTAVQFDGSGSMDPDGTISSYSWDFGDSSAAGTGVMPTHTYSAAGNYTVTLTVTDNSGMTGSSTAMANITAATTGTPAPATADKFNQYCSACHGTNNSGGSAGPVKGTSVSSINSAINNVGSMNSLSSLSSADIQDISSYLSGTGTGTGTGTGGGTGACTSVGDESDRTTSGSDTGSSEEDHHWHGSHHHSQNCGTTTPTTPADPAPTSQSSTLYDTYCSACHGAGGTGTSTAGSVVGASSQDIKEAIGEVRAMSSLSSLSDGDISAIANYLGSTGQGGGRNAEASGTGQNAQGIAKDNASGGGGALGWLTLLLTGIWVGIRRR